VRRYLLLFLLSSAALAAGFAPAPLPRPERRPRPDGNEMLGSWGQKNGSANVLLIKEGIMFYYPPGGNEYALTINPRAHPRTYDLTGVPGGHAAGSEYVGIYKVEGDKLTLCYVGGKVNRPTAFEGPGSQGATIEIYDRVGR
jgi:uncharacterized protein (TIGR03067 family)